MKDEDTENEGSVVLIVFLFFGSWFCVFVLVFSTVTPKVRLLQNSTVLMSYI